MPQSPVSMTTNLARYERIAPFYDLLDLPFERRRYQALRPLMFQNLGGRLLDVGIGTGRNCAFYPPDAFVSGIDTNPAMLARAHRRCPTVAAGGRLYQMDAAVPRLEARTERQPVALQGDPPTAARLPSGCVFSTRCRHAEPGCRESEPDLQDNLGHAVACWRWRELASIAESDVAQVRPAPAAADQRTAPLSVENGRNPPS